METAMDGGGMVQGVLAGEEQEGLEECSAICVDTLIDVGEVQ